MILGKVKIFNFNISFRNNMDMLFWLLQNIDMFLLQCWTGIDVLSMFELVWYMWQHEYKIFLYPLNCSINKQHFSTSIGNKFPYIVYCNILFYFDLSHPLISSQKFSKLVFIEVWLHMEWQLMASIIIV